MTRAISLALTMALTAAASTAPPADSPPAAPDLKLAAEVPLPKASVRGSWGLAFSPDGKKVATFDGGAAVWDLATLKPTGEIKYARGGPSIGKAAFRPDGTTLVSMPHGGDDAIRVWDLATGKEAHAWKGLADGAQALAACPTGPLVAVACGDRTGAGKPAPVRVVDAATGKEAAVLKGHTAMVRAVAFSPDGKVVASGGQDMTVRLWDAATGRALAVVPRQPNSVGALAYSPDGKLLAAGYELGKFVTVYAVGDKAPVARAQLPSSHVTALAFSPDGKYLAVATSETAIPHFPVTLLYEVGTKKLVGRVPEEGHCRLNAVGFARDGKVLVTASYGLAGRVALWEVPAK
jgi:WD40 repeat protein